MLKNTMLKRIWILLIMIMMIGSAMQESVFAETLKDYYFKDQETSTPSESWNGSSSKDELHEIELAGSDEIQNKKSTQLVNVSEYQESYEVEVYASLPSEFTVSIPKIVTLDASGENSSQFAVGVKGALAPNYAVTSTVDPSIEMTNTRDERMKFNAVISTYTDSLTLFYGWELIGADSYNGDGLGYYKINNEKAPVPGSYTGTFNIRFDLIDLNRME